MVNKTQKQLSRKAKSSSPASQVKSSSPRISGEITLAGLEQDVQVIRDQWGVPHIYANTVHDLFFAQGFVSAQDRLWQMEFWRRAGEGSLSEILGSAFIQRDKVARLLRYRGDMDREWRSYGADTKSIVSAFVKGINAYIESNKQDLPIEFKILGFEPKPWTPEVCTSRFTTFTMGRNANSEVLFAELVRSVGVDMASKILNIDSADLRVPEGLNLDDINSHILRSLTEFLGLVSFQAEGSNNWVVSGDLTESGKPILANDPHRVLSVPSVRYIVHLVGPGWNVIGAADPFLPGVSAGHNDRVAFGFTVFRMDQQDIYVEETHPSNPRLYRHKGRWRKMTVECDRLDVKGRSEPVEIELLSTLHGPVIFEDQNRHRAYTLRWIGMEAGSAGFLGSLAINRASNWRQFVRALRRWKAPPENFVYADIDGNIGWQVAGLAPKRRRWSGLLPVPGNLGKYEWSGFIPFSELPSAYNPSTQFIATANQNVVPLSSKHKFGFEWAAPFRFRRIEEVIKSRQRWTVKDFELLQLDEISMPAREIVPLLDQLVIENETTRQAVALLKNWNQVLSKGSAAAALFEVWLAKLFVSVFSPLVTTELWPRLERFMSVEVLIDFLTRPQTKLAGGNCLDLKRILTKSLREAIHDLETRLGGDMKKWRWGDLHFAEFKHPLWQLSPGLGDPMWVACGGDLDSVNGTSGEGLSVTVGASYRQIIDLSDWDSSVAVNAPGQSGAPESEHFADLLPLWSAGQYFPLLFSKKSIEKNAKNRLTLKASRKTK